MRSCPLMGSLNLALLVCVEKFLAKEHIALLHARGDLLRSLPAVSPGFQPLGVAALLLLFLHGLHGFHC